MKTIIWLGLTGMVGVVTTGGISNVAFAQSARSLEHGNMGRGGISPPHSAPIRPYPRHPFAAPIYPLGFGGYDFGDYDYGYMPEPPSPVAIEPPPPPPYGIIPERPPERARMVIHEYQAPSAAATVGSGADQPLFAIVLKNGTTLSASAVIIQNDALHIVDPEGGHQKVSLEAVDREATTRVNRERKLQLQLPPGR